MKFSLDINSYVMASLVISAHQALYLSSQCTGGKIKSTAMHTHHISRSDGNRERGNMKSDFGGTDVHRVVANVATAGGSGNSPTSDSRMAAWEISLFFQLISSENFHGSMNLPISLLEADPEETPSGTDGHQRKRSIARIDRSMWSSI